MAATSRSKPLARWRWFSYERSRISPSRLKNTARRSAFCCSPLLRPTWLRRRNSGIILQPLQRKESPFQLSQFAQREGQTVLPGLGCELAQDHRGGDRSGFDGHCESQKSNPMISNDANIDGTRHEGRELGRD